MSALEQLIHRGPTMIIKRYHRKKPRQGRWPKQKRRGMHAGLRAGRIAWSAHFGMWLYRTELTTGTIGARPRVNPLLSGTGTVIPQFHGLSKPLNDEINTTRKP